MGLTEHAMAGGKRPGQDPSTAVCAFMMVTLKPHLYNQNVSDFHRFPVSATSFLT